MTPPLRRFAFPKDWKSYLLHPERSLERMLIKARRDFLIVLAVVVLNAIFQQIGFYDRYELLDFDYFARGVLPSDSPELSLVVIDDKLYHDPRYFDGISPLKQAVAAEIIQAIVRVHPKVLAVDLDTSDWPPDAREKIEQTDPLVHVVWSAEPNGQSGIETAKGERFGVPEFQPDIDGKIRKWRPGVPGPHVYLVEPLHCFFTPSLAFAVVAATDSTKPQCPPNADDEFIAFGLPSHRFRTLKASLFLDQQFSRTVFGDAIAGKTVFLGGTYREARDSYATPLTFEPGIEINAQAAQTALSGGVPQLNTLRSLLGDIVLSTAVLAVVVWLQAVPALLASGAISMFVTWRVSEFTYHNRMVFLPLSTVFGGAVVACIVEVCCQHWELRKELRPQPVVAHRAAPSGQPVEFP